jgi:hypothetical protein
MPRSQGFARGDIDTAFPLDDKFLALRGSLTPERYYAATGVYFHVVASTWREAERKVAARIVPDAADLIAELVTVGLLDPDGRLPGRAFTAWVGRARRQRKASTERQARKRAENTNTKSQLGDTPPSTDPPDRAQKSRAVTPLSRVTSRDTAGSAGTVGPEGTEGTETGGAGGADPWAEPEVEALQWLAVHGCDIRPGNGFHTKLITGVERHGVNAIVGMFDRLAAAGTRDGDIKGFLFGALDVLDSRTRPDLRAIEAEERADEREQVKRKRKRDPLLDEIGAAYRAAYAAEGIET